MTPTLLLIALFLCALIMPALWHHYQQQDDARDLIDAAHRTIEAYDSLATSPRRRAPDWRRASEAVRELERVAERAGRTWRVEEENDGD